MTHSRSLPFGWCRLPPAITTNHSYQLRKVFIKGGKGTSRLGMMKTPLAKEWLENAPLTLKAFGAPLLPADQKVSLEIVFIVANPRQDVDGSIKPVQDALEKAMKGPDPLPQYTKTGKKKASPKRWNDTNILSLHVFKMVDPSDPHILVRVSPYEPQADLPSLLATLGESDG